MMEKARTSTHAGVDQHEIPGHRTDHIGENAEEPADGLHPGVAQRARRTFGRHVGDDRARGIETDVDRKIQSQRHGRRHHEQVADAQRAVDRIDVRQRQQHHRRQRTADHDERPTPPSPEPDPVADEADDDLPDDPGQRSCGPHDPHLMDIQMIPRGQEPAECRDLDRQGKAHRGRRQTDQCIELSPEVTLECVHERSVAPSIQ